jgi:oxygen-independent coproporphyrinogen-3 oxidase
MAFRKYILDISCKGETKFQPDHLSVLEQYTFQLLPNLAKDGLIEWNREGLKLTTQGHDFTRNNVCSAFDLHLQRSIPGKQVFSKAI